MKYREIGNSGIKAPVVAFGAWAIGGWMWGGTEEQESINALNTAIDNGMNFIDTAPVYGFGVSEEIVGKAIKGKRDKVILATKCGLRWDLDKPKGTIHFYATDNGVSKEKTDKPVFKYLNPKSIRYEIEQSLKRLQSDYIDLYQTHWQDTTTPIDESKGELIKLKDEGKIRAIGVSNATTAQMNDYGDIQADQEKFNMFQRKSELTGNLDYCKNKGIAFLAYSPLAQGLLTGKINPGQTFPDGEVRNTNPLFSAENIKKANLMLEEWKPLCEKHNADLGQITAAWTFEYPGVTHILLGTRTVEQAIRNAKSGDIQLVAEDIKIINTSYEKYLSKPEVL